jgi:hypothetical protein
MMRWAGLLGALVAAAAMADDEAPVGRRFEALDRPPAG